MSGGDPGGRTWRRALPGVRAAECGLRAAGRLTDRHRAVCNSVFGTSEEAQYLGWPPFPASCRGNAAFVEGGRDLSEGVSARSEFGDFGREGKRGSSARDAITAFARMVPLRCACTRRMRRSSAAFWTITGPSGPSIHFGKSWRRYTRDTVEGRRLSRSWRIITGCSLASPKWEGSSKTAPHWRRSYFALLSGISNTPKRNADAAVWMATTIIAKDTISTRGTICKFNEPKPTAADWNFTRASNTSRQKEGQQSALGGS